MSVNRKVVLWSKAGCHYCNEIKEYFQENNISYQQIDVGANDNYRDILEVKYGIRHVPVVEIQSGDSSTYEAVLSIQLEDVKAALA